MLLKYSREPRKSRKGQQVFTLIVPEFGFKQNVTSSCQYFFPNSRESTNKSNHSQKQDRCGVWTISERYLTFTAQQPAAWTYSTSKPSAKCIRNPGPSHWQRRMCIQWWIRRKFLPAQSILQLPGSCTILWNSGISLLVKHLWTL
jgi:hypothetical protein